MSRLKKGASRKSKNWAKRRKNPKKPAVIGVQNKISRLNKRIAKLNSDINTALKAGNTYLVEKLKVNLLNFLHERTDSIKKLRKL